MDIKSTASGRISPDILQARLLEAVTKQLPDSQEEIIQALRMAEKAHEGQTRKSATKDLVVPYIVHPLRVALILVEENSIAKQEALCAALLHDAIEDSCGRITYAHIHAAFGGETATLVAKLTKPQGLGERGRLTEEQHESYFEGIRQGSNLLRAIKFSDRVDNLRDALQLDSSRHASFMKKCLDETRRVYLPMSLDSGSDFAWFYSQMQELCQRLEQTLS
jgi:(p)ppGpp synthase/HD superfamily hydrolase